MIVNDYDDLILSSSEKWSVPFEWIKAIIGAESDFNPGAFRQEASGVASYGLMQILDSTARGLGYTGEIADLYLPSVNIDLGAKLLAELRNSYGDDFRQVYSAYNSGSPSKYLTNSSVAAHVTRALGYLEQVTESMVSDISQTIDEYPAASGGGAAILIGVTVLYFILKKGK